MKTVDDILLQGRACLDGEVKLLGPSDVIRSEPGSRPHTSSSRPYNSRSYKVYPPLPASEETFIHQAAREIQEDPNIINKMFERFSVQILTDMKRKARSRGQRESLRTTPTPPDPTFWGIASTSGYGSTKFASESTMDKLTPLPKPESKSKGWRLAKKIATRRESTFSSNLFNLFLQSKHEGGFNKSTKPRERQTWGDKTFAALPASHINLQTSIVRERHDLNAARRARTVFPFSGSGI